MPDQEIRDVVPADETRPRFGQILRADGSTAPVVFRQLPDEPTRFEALNAADESPVAVGKGDRLSVDVIGPGQSVVFGSASDE